MSFDAANQEVRCEIPEANPAVTPEAVPRPHASPPPGARSLYAAAARGTGSPQCPPAAPNIVVMVVGAGEPRTGRDLLCYRLGTAEAGITLVKVVMLMQMMSAGAVGGGIASAVARALRRSHRRPVHAAIGVGRAGFLR